jgi:hypothetical protein
LIKFEACAKKPVKPILGVSLHKFLLSLVLLAFLNLPSQAHAIEMSDVTTYAYNVVLNKGTLKVPKDVVDRTNQLDPQRHFLRTEGSSLRPYLHIGTGKNDEHIFLRANPRQSSFGVIDRPSLEVVILDKGVDQVQFEKIRNDYDIAVLRLSDFKKDELALQEYFVQKVLSLSELVVSEARNGTSFKDFRRFGPPSPAGTLYVTPEGTTFYSGFLEKHLLTGQTYSEIHLEDFRGYSFEGVNALLSSLVQTRQGYAPGTFVSENKAFKPLEVD